MDTALRIATATVLLFAFWTTASAVRFPDVTSGYPHRKHVEELSDKGVIGGNPDGTFRPYDPVNRAAALKMAYLAAGKVPDAGTECFPDVEPGSWYAIYVCDAYEEGFVQGYEDPKTKKKSFKPAQPVTRAEAIKLTLAVFGIPPANLNAPVKMYRDIKPGDWPAIHVHTALALGILPIEGQSGEDFKPHALLERGEMAAYLNIALPHKVRPADPVPESSSSSSAESSVSSSSVSAQDSSAMGELERRAAAALKTQQQEEEALRRAKENTRTVSIPFSDKRSFDGGLPYSYEFSTTQTFTAEFAATLAAGQTGGITCRLYHLGRSGFTQEYYLGVEEGSACVIRAAISPGDWRLQLEADASSASFSVTGKKITGDGNDGFPEAMSLKVGESRVGLLDADDQADWFKIVVPRTQDVLDFGGLKVKIRVITSGTLGCIVYPLFDVDVFGFVGPECEREELLPPGTYVIGVRHIPTPKIKQTYTVKVEAVK